MSIIILILQVVIIIGAYWLFDYIKKVPDQIHKKNLETFKNELQKEIVKLEASESNLHLKKIEKFTEFSGALYDVLNGVKYKDVDDEELKENATKSMESFTKDIMFFAGENTIKKFVEYRRYSQLLTNEGGKDEQAKFNYILAELILEMRKDLGYDDKVDVDDYLYILIRDWDENKELFKERSNRAKQLKK
ncbi:hypothetical protein [Oceanobacillus alkalisoli]|uniref:hypothetical protein n=1 Tax=Oceanobacillus alkalisoli TaxID=2925113 RepID=UPI001EF0883D|nr:hypothetical protein [Oceanobacillus alkalisoli]MCF3942196.1 hypothetical protein [Oceanobacillus alkalisoli]MCG5104434.1 hypothetical protein [Oceanobacillus alkalisoli]